MSELIKPIDGFVSPTIIEERKLNVASMDVFSRLMMDRIIFLGSDIDSNVANTINAQLLFLDSVDNSQDITMYINSPGGSVYDGLAIYDTMQMIHADVKTICIGMGASMASILLSGGTKGKRFALPHSRVLIHQPLGGAKGQASDITIVAEEINKLKNELYQILSNNTGQSLEKITKDADRDFYMTAKEALEYGIIDKIIEN